MKHLGSNNNRFPGTNTFIDDHFLNSWYFFVRYFNSQITPCNHYPVNMRKDLIEIIHTFLIFNFCYYLDAGTTFIEYILNGRHIALVADKRMGNEVNILFYCKANVF